MSEDEDLDDEDVVEAYNRATGEYIPWWAALLLYGIVGWLLFSNWR